MSNTTHRAFFGDAERTFKITADLIVELERKTDAGIGRLCRRLFAGDFHVADVSETIRLGLIGGGATPGESSALVAAYVTNRPLSETFPIAVAILEALWSGSNPEAANAQA